MLEILSPGHCLSAPSDQDWNGAGLSRFIVVVLLVWMKLLFMPIQRLLDDD